MLWVLWFAGSFTGRVNSCFFDLEKLNDEISELKMSCTFQKLTYKYFKTVLVNEKIWPVILVISLNENIFGQNKICDVEGFSNTKGEILNISVSKNQDEILKTLLSKCLF